MSKWNKYCLVFVLILIFSATPCGFAYSEKGHDHEKEQPVNWEEFFKGLPNKMATVSILTA